MDNGNSSRFEDLGDLEDLGTWKDLEGLGRTWGVVVGLRGLGGRGEISPGRFWCDPRNFAQVEQVVDAAQILPTPCPRPGFRPSFDPRKKTRVENRPEMPGSSRFWPGKGLFRPSQCCLGRAESGPGQIWPDPGSWPFLGSKMGPEKSGFAINHFVVGRQGNCHDPNEFYCI